ncbi:hypothetical protein D9M72_614840 [compost metagenome]
MGMARSNEARVVVGQAPCFYHHPCNRDENRTEEDMQAIEPSDRDGQEALARRVADAERHAHEAACDGQKQRQ